ncbi:hypothetical protein ACFX13_012796 [Malus domestica]
MSKESYQDVKLQVTMALQLDYLGLLSKESLQDVKVQVILPLQLDLHHYLSLKNMMVTLISSTVMERVTTSDCHAKVRKRNDDIIVRANSTVIRSWNEMPHDTLVSILERVPWFHYGFSVCYLCQSWLMAFLDVVTPNNAMDLRFMDLVVEFDSPRRLFDFLRIVFKWRSHWYWKKLYLPKAILIQQLLTWIAERYSTEGPPDLCIIWVIPYCKNLKAVHLGRICLETISQCIANS